MIPNCFECLLQLSACGRLCKFISWGVKDWTAVCFSYLGIDVWRARIELMIVRWSSLVIDRFFLAWSAPLTINITLGRFHSVLFENLLVRLICWCWLGRINAKLRWRLHHLNLADSISRENNHSPSFGTFGAFNLWKSHFFHLKFENQSQSNQFRISLSAIEELFGSGSKHQLVWGTSCS